MQSNAKAQQSNPSLERLKEGAALILSAARGDPPASTYAPDWFVRAHPTSFPNGKGGTPMGMSLKAWIVLHLHRFPREQYAQNVPFVMDAFNILQRHAASVHAGIQVRLTPSLVAKLGHVSTEDMALTVKLLTSGECKSTLNAKLKVSPAYASYASGVVPESVPNLKKLKSHSLRSPELRTLGGGAVRKHREGETVNLMMMILTGVVSLVRFICRPTHECMQCIYGDTITLFGAGSCIWRNYARNLNEILVDDIDLSHRPYVCCLCTLCRLQTHALVHYSMPTVHAASA